MFRRKLTTVTETVTSLFYDTVMLPVLNGSQKRRTRPKGFTLFEIIFVGALALLVATGVLMSITSTGYAQARAELLFTADMLLTTQVEEAFRTPYDDLESLSGTEKVEQNGFSFELTTKVSPVSEIGVDGVKQVSLELSWEDRTGKGHRGRNLVRSKPW